MFSKTSMKHSDFEKAKTTEMERYCVEHPRSPAALRRPQILIRGRTCVALLGRNITGGIVGFGATVAAALRAFDVQYLRAVRPPQG